MKAPSKGFCLDIVLSACFCLKAHKNSVVGQKITMFVKKMSSGYPLREEGGKPITL